MLARGRLLNTHDLVAAHGLRGNAFVARGEYDRAIADYDEAIRFSPDFAATFINRSLAYLDKGDYDRSIADSDQAIR